MPRKSVTLFGVHIDAIDMDGAVQAVLAWCMDSAATRCQYVVTPNVDHAVMLQTRDDLMQAYSGAALVLADGAPLVGASRLLGRPLPERVAGSDLVPAIFDQVSQKPVAKPLRIFLLGAAPGVADRAAQAISKKWQNVCVVGTYSPPIGFENDMNENERILTLIAEADPHLLLVGLGAPKQELWVARHSDRLAVRVALCVGATIDFLAEEKIRSPRWMQRLGLEWFHRLCSEPSRLAKRYLRDAWVFPRLVWREWRHRPPAC